MLDDYKTEQPIVHRILTNAIKNDKISHAYLFETKGYAKSFDIAVAFVKAIECLSPGYEACGTCHSCIQIESNNFLDFKIIDPDGLWIKKSEMANLQNEFSRKPTVGNKKIYIINNAEKLNPSSANSILKFLEEPEDNIIAILITDNSYKLLKTITSRCQLITFINNTSKQDEQFMVKLGSLFYNNSNKIKEYSENVKNEEKVQFIINFFNYFEKHGKDLLLYTEKLWHCEIKNKEEATKAMDIAIVFYKDVLNQFLNRDIMYFKKHDEIAFIVSKNTEESISNKIKILLEYKDKIKYNINLKLFIDKLIIDLMEA